MNFRVFLAVLATLLLLPLTYADTPGFGVGIDLGIETEADAPHCWMDPETRLVLMNPADGSVIAVQRTQNYAFQGEQIIMQIVCQDRNGHEDLNNVHVIAVPCEYYECVENPDNEGCPEFEEAECYEISRVDDPGAIGARDENGNYISFDPTTMLWYSCEFSVETMNSMHGEFWIVPEACDKGSNSDVGVQCTHIDEAENWCLNPEIQLSYYPATGIDFGTVLPGTRAYSNSLHIVNVEDPACECVSEGIGGADLYMMISGTDFYDPANSGARCPYTNALLLENFAYFATQGAYSTWTNFGADIEGYDTIPYETGDISNREYIIDMNPILHPGNELTITFRLDLPRPCIGNFENGQFLFWGEAV